MRGIAGKTENIHYETQSQSTFQTKTISKLEKKERRENTKLKIKNNFLDDKNFKQNSKTRVAK